MFGKPPLERRALLAATLGALYGVLWLPTPGPNALGLNFLGLAWFLLAFSLVFLTPLAFHAFSAWCILWIVWRAVDYVKVEPGEMRAAPFVLVLELALPALALFLLLTSGYLAQARALTERDETVAG